MRLDKNDSFGCMSLTLQKVHSAVRVMSSPTNSARHRRSRIILCIGIVAKLGRRSTPVQFNVEAKIFEHCRCIIRMPGALVYDEKTSPASRACSYDPAYREDVHGESLHVVCSGCEHQIIFAI